MNEDHRIRTRVEVYEDVFRDNDAVAGKIFSVLAGRGASLVNVLGTPGAGKTSFLEALIRRLSPLSCAVIEADLESDIDADRLRASGIAAVQIQTHGMCHLDAPLVEKVIPELPPEARIVFVENVGNLICPSSFYLGEKKRILIVSTTEGSDKPYKYPPAFLSSSLVIVNKIDLEVVMEFDRRYFIEGLRSLDPRIPLLFVSAKTGEGMAEAEAWIRENVLA
ncbi:MAG: hydrogenase nickel incorporation protein HypB [Spirochaetes bacterium]|nr:hydrogenase nickel incorporation protein HypB [Spirochaetota bacterium]